MPVTARCTPSSVLGEQARAGPTRSTRPWPRAGPGPAGRRAGRPEGQPLHPRRADHLLVADPRGLAARPTTPRWSSGCVPPARSWSARRTSTSSRWAPPPRTRAPARPATPTTTTGCPAVERRIGRGGRGRVRAARARLGHRRLDPPAGGALRRGRPQAHLRGGLPLRPGRLRLLARPDRPVRHHGRRRRAPAGGDRRPRPAGHHLARRSPPPRWWWPSSGASRGCGSGSWSELVDGRRARGRGPGPGGGRGARARPGRRSRRSRCRSSATGCPPTTSSRRPRRPPTSPATTACATACGSTGPTWPR